MAEKVIEFFDPLKNERTLFGIWGVALPGVVINELPELFIPTKTKTIHQTM